MFYSVSFQQRRIGDYNSPIKYANEMNKNQIVWQPQEA